jgi:tRNA(fMet)-specific endonuclease VapC
LTVIDTSALIPFLNGSPEEVQKIGDLLNSGEHLAITIITVYEMHKGAYLSSRPEDNLKDVNETISNMHILDLTPQACEEASRIFSELKKSGKMISEFDILIAAIAKTNGQAILTKDQHFKSIKGIDLTQW